MKRAMKAFILAAYADALEIARLAKQRVAIVGQRSTVDCDSIQCSGSPWFTRL